jgi:hypothetical protein
LLSSEPLDPDSQFGGIVPEGLELVGLDPGSHHREDHSLCVVVEGVPIEDFLGDGSAAVNAMIGGARAATTAGVGLVDVGEVGLPEQTLPWRGREVPHHVHGSRKLGNELELCVGGEDEYSPPLLLMAPSRL